MNILKPYDKSVPQPHPKCGKTMTEQHHAKSCDINTIMAKYQKTGLIDHVTQHQGTYGDVSGADFKKAQDLVAEQKSIFYELPSEVRTQFDNDPANYLDLVCEPDGLVTLQDMLNPAPEEPENAPPKPSSEGTKDGEQEEKPVT